MRATRGGLALLILGAAIGAASALVLSRRGPAPSASHAATPAGCANPPAAFRELCEGNRRFREGHAAHPHVEAARLHELVLGQHPNAVVVTCADSRVAPELIFDQWLGDLFTIRVAGNVAVPSVIGSVEYAVEHLGARVVLVLGHTNCGAVKAALDAHGKPAVKSALTPALARIVSEILPAFASLDPVPDAERLAAGVRANTRYVAKTLVDRSELLSRQKKEGALEIIPAVYSLEELRLSPVGTGP